MNNDEIHSMLVKAVACACAERWDEAHAIVQIYEDDSTSCWIHAILHKIEGDRENARYWYGRAEKQWNDMEPQSELELVRQALAQHG